MNLNRVLVQMGRQFHKPKLFKEDVCNGQKIKSSCGWLLFVINHDKANYPDGVSITELSNKLRVKTPSITQIINELEKCSLIERRADKKDRRVVRIVLTEDGQKFVDDHEEKAMTEIKGVVDYLGEEKARQLTLLLNDIYDYFKAKSEQ